MLSKEQLLARESRWTMVAGIASVAGVALIIASMGNSAAWIRGEADLYGWIMEAQTGKLVFAGVLQLVGWSLLAVPLLFLFRAAAARTDRMRTGLALLVVAAPLMFGLSGLISAPAVLQSADILRDQPADQIDKCVAGKKDDQAKEKKSAEKTDEKSDEADDFVSECRTELAQDARGAAPLMSLEVGLFLGGALGFTIAVFYTSLWAMRTGLLTRFWGALGVALGAVFVLFFQFTLIWFIYVGLLLAGWVPGGRPKAWAAGEAVMPPPPSGGGGGLFGRAPAPPGPAGGDDADQVEGEVIEGEATELTDAGEAPVVGEDGTLQPPPAKRKRKKRDA